MMPLTSVSTTSWCHFHLRPAISASPSVSPFFGCCSFRRVGFDLIQRDPFGEGLVAHVGGGARGAGQRGHQRGHADRDDGERHQHFDECESAARAPDRVHVRLPSMSLPASIVALVGAG